MTFNRNEFITADKLEKNEKNDVETKSVEIIDEKTENVEKQTNIQDLPVTVNVTADITTDGELPDYAILNPNLHMETKVAVATRVANCLSDLIEQQGLVKRGINKKEPEKPYVLVEGWEILGTMLGIVPVTRIVDEMKNKNNRTVGFKARATLYRNPIVENGEIVGGELLSTAEAYATKDGFQKEFFSMASMAQTRALGKAYRMTLSWIMKMAGYEPTPAEEMPDFNKKN